MASEKADEGNAFLRTALVALLSRPTREFRRRAWRTFEQALDRHFARNASQAAPDAALSRASVSSRPSSSMLSKSPGETVDPVTASRIG